MRQHSLFFWVATALLKSAADVPSVLASAVLPEKDTIVTRHSSSNVDEERWLQKSATEDMSDRSMGAEITILTNSNHVSEKNNNDERGVDRQLEESFQREIEGPFYNLVHTPMSEWDGELWALAIALIIFVMYCFGCSARFFLVPCCFFGRGTTGDGRYYQYTDGYGYRYSRGPSAADRSFAKQLLCLLCCWECCCDENRPSNGCSSVQEALCCFCCFEFCCDNGRIVGEALEGTRGGYSYGAV